MPENEWILLARAWLALATARIGARDAAQHAAHRLQRAWEEGALHLRGVPHAIPQTREPVEIPAWEAGRLRLDCPRSRLGRPRLWDYHSVQVRKADVERLAREAGGNRAGAETQAQAAPPDEVAVAPDAGGNRAGAETQVQAAPPDEVAVAPDANEADTKPQAAAETQAQAAPPDEGAVAPDAHEADTKPQAAAPYVQEAGKLARAVAWWLRHLFPDGRPAMRLEELAALVRKEAGKRLGDFGLTTLKRAIRLAWPPGQTGPDRAKPGQPSR